MATKKNTAIKKGNKSYEYFKITRTVGHEFKDGKKIPIKKQFYGTSKGDAEKQFRAYQEEQLQKKYEKDHAEERAKLKTFGEYAEEYTYEVLPVSSYAHGTKIRYEESYRVHVKGTWVTAEAQRRGYQTEFIFTTKSGGLLNQRNVRRSLNRYYDNIGVPKKSPHTYRATFCTELCRAGVPLEVTSKLMGHKSIEVTAKHYALVKQDVQIDAINRLPGIGSRKI